MQERICGVYAITYIQNGKQYIGSSVNVYQRWSVHASYLRKGTHHSTLLQQDWNNGSPEDFIVDIIERTEAKDLISREQFYINTLTPAYNISKVAGNAFRDPEIQARLPRGRDQREYLPEHGAKISASLTGKKLTDEHREHISQAQIGKEITPEWRKNISEAMKGNPNVSKPKSDEHKESVRQTLKAKWQDPEYRAMMQEKMRLGKLNKEKKPRSQESRDRTSRARKAAWQRQVEEGTNISPERDSKTGRFLKKFSE